MGRWEPDARGRLGRAAMELYLERGYDETTVADIADRAGLTERTFFRHYADKREVLFDGSGALLDLLVSTVEGAPDATAPLDVVAAAVEAAAVVLQENRLHARSRQRVIAANAVLQERELIKMATLAAAVAGALRSRGVPDLAATLTAESGVVVFRVAFEAWVEDPERRDFVALVREAFDELRAVATGCVR